MFRNYVITALRNFTHHKMYTFINVAGLTVGFICATFIILFVRDELSYDRWIPGTENLYRVEVTWFAPGQPPLPVSVTPFPAPDAMLAQLPEVKSAVHLEPYQMTVATQNRQFLDHINVVSPNFFQVIQLPLIAGDRSRLLSQPESAVITESAARKYFGSKSAIGEVLKVGELCEYGPNISDCVLRESSVIVTGIIRDFPHNTQLSGDVFIPNTSGADPMSQDRKKAWLGSHGYGYVELQPSANAAALIAKLPALIDRNVDPRKTAGIPMSGSEIMHLGLTRFRDDHLSTDRYQSLTPAGSWTTVYGFTAIGVLILLIACFNFTNLATARALARAREISLRKVMGARRPQLMIQFLSESILMALTSLILALSLVEGLLPFYTRMLAKPVQLSYLSDWPLFLILIGLAVLVGLLGGWYPAVVLSRFRPASVLRTSASGQSPGSALLRNILVVMQFAVSIGLGIAALVVFSQVSYARKLDLGLNKDEVVIVSASGLPAATRESLVRALNAEPLLKGATLSGDVPFSGHTSNVTIEFPDEGGLKTSMVRTLGINPDFLSTYDIHLLSGRGLSASHGEDVRREDSPNVNVLINRAAAQRFGYSPQGALGKSFYSSNSSGNIKKLRLTIVGVTADFMFEGDRKEVVPTFYTYNPTSIDMISVRIPTSNSVAALSTIDRVWHAFAPSIAVNRHFLDADFDKQFLSDERQGSVFGIFVGVAIFIACLGLYGLAAFSTERRIREIGLRKVFGAHTGDIVYLLLWQFSIPVFVANLIAWPIAYYYLRNWLDGYAHRIDLSPLYFLGAGVIAILVAWATVFSHALRVARANPIHALRYE